MIRNLVGVFAFFLVMASICEAAPFLGILGDALFGHDHHHHHHGYGYGGGYGGYPGAYGGYPGAYGGAYGSPYGYGGYPGGYGYGSHYGHF